MIQKSRLKRSITIACFCLFLFAGLLSTFAVASQATTENNLGKPRNHNPKIETRLEVASRTAQNEGIGAAKQQALSAGLVVAEPNSLDVVIEMQRGRILNKASLRELYGEILGQADRFYEVRLPIANITRLPETIGGVSYIRTPYSAKALGVEYGTILSEGVNLTGGGLFHSKNLLGQDVKIAVIDVGFASFKYAKEAGEFSEGVVVDKKDYVGSGLFTYSAHGTKVAEIVHDMAPKSKLYLKRVKTGVDLKNATQDAISQGVDIIVHSVGWVNTNFGDGTGMIADIAREASEAGILWVNAAGNSAQRHWEGEARDEDGNGWVEFANGEEKLSVKVDYSSTIQAFLTWNDWPESDTDFDFFLYNEDGNLLSSSKNHQTGGDPPAESITHSARPDGNYYLKISAPERYSSSRLEIFSFNHRLDPNVESSSILAPGNVEEIFTVGAINMRSWKSGPIEPFSSRGPTSDGRTKPDIASIDGVSTYLSASFLGTSAAAPYSAGAAALILSREPDFDSGQIKTALLDKTQDLGDPGPDNVYGWGKMRLIYKNPSASRTIEVGENEGLEPGEKLAVTVKAAMPVTLQGGLKLTEEVPEPLEVLEVNKPDTATKTDHQVSTEWSIVSPGSEKELSYEVLVPEDTPPGDYEFSGSINGNSTGGTSTATVLEPSGDSTSKGHDLIIKDVNALPSELNGQVKFKASGENISQIRVRVYSTSGREVFDSEWRQGVDYQWNYHDNSENRVPNGIYLYYVKVKGTDGETKRSGIDKILVLR